eukprot:4546522-Pyramimonas_sp.AAC.1
MPILAGPIAVPVGNESAALFIWSTAWAPAAAHGTAAPLPAAAPPDRAPGAGSRPAAGYARQ